MITYKQNFPHKKCRRFFALAAQTALCLSALTQIVSAGYDKNYIGEMETYTAVYEDTLVHLARKHDLGFVEMRAANPLLDPWIPGEGAEVVIPKMNLLPDAPREGIVINLAEMRIYAYLNGDEAPSTYPIGIGREGLETPLGETTVTWKKDGPTWRPTPRMREEDPELPEAVPPGPDNPLGTHAVYLGWPTYLIHGTNRPYGIGRRVSSGCIRMYPEDIKTFFSQVPAGVKVNVIDQPLKVSWIDNDLYIEAHPTIEDSIKMEETGVVSETQISDEDVSKITDVAGRYADLLNWPRIREAVRERAGYPVRIARVIEDGSVDVVNLDDAEVLDDAIVADENIDQEPEASVEVDEQKEPEQSEEQEEDVTEARASDAPKAQDAEEQSLSTILPPNLPETRKENVSQTVEN